MTIVNTTFVLDNVPVKDIFRRIQLEYIPSAQRHGVTRDSLITEVLDAQGNSTGGYAVHIYFPTTDEAMSWCEGEGCKIRESITEVYGERVLMFTTYLKVL